MILGHITVCWFLSHLFSNCFQSQHLNPALESTFLASVVGMNINTPKFEGQKMDTHPKCLWGVVEILIQDLINWLFWRMWPVCDGIASHFWQTCKSWDENLSQGKSIPKHVVFTCILMRRPWCFIFPTNNRWIRLDRTGRNRTGYDKTIMCKLK